MASKSCTHIKVTGVRCGSPALRGEQFCYFHQRMLRSVRFPSSRVLRSALLEDPESIQASLMEVVNGLLRGTLELKRGELILRALNTAVRNIRRVRFDFHQEEMVREIPNYPDPPMADIDEPAAAEPRRPPTRAEVARSREALLVEYFGGADKVHAAYKTGSPANAAPTKGNAPNPAPTQAWPDTFVPPEPAANVGNVGTAAAVRNVGTAAPGCPGGPELPGRSAAPKSTKPKATRKPPQSVNREARTVTAQAPKERKNAAHRASGG